MSDLSHLKASLLLEKNGHTWLGGSRVALLEAIDTLGSITAAAKATGISYKTAWEIVDGLNNLSDRPLVLRSTGGRHGGGSTLSEEGKTAIRLFRAGEQRFQQWLDRVAQDLDGFAGFDDWIRRFAMRTSARNQFLGRVDTITPGPVNSRVAIRLDQDNQIVAVVTTDSVARLVLEIGTEVYALIKAPSVILADESVRLSAENRLCGTVTRILEGAVNREVVLTLAHEKTVTAIVTADAPQASTFVLGQRACALFTGASVIIARS